MYNHEKGVFDQPVATTRLAHLVCVLVRTGARDHRTQLAVAFCRRSGETCGSSSCIACSSESIGHGWLGGRARVSQSCSLVRARGEENSALVSSEPDREKKCGVSCLCALAARGHSPESVPRQGCSHCDLLCGSCEPTKRTDGGWGIHCGVASGRYCGPDMRRHPKVIADLFERLAACP